MYQKTLDDQECVISPSGREHIIDHTQVEPRELDALRVYDSIQRLNSKDVDPMEYSYDDAMDMFLGRDKHIA